RSRLSRCLSAHDSEASASGCLSVHESEASASGLGGALRESEASASGLGGALRAPLGPVAAPLASSLRAPFRPHPPHDGRFARHVLLHPKTVELWSVLAPSALRPTVVRRQRPLPPGVLQARTARTREAAGSPDPAATTN